MNQIFCWHKYMPIEWSKIEHITYEGRVYETTCHIIYKCEKCSKVKKCKNLPYMEDSKMNNLIK